MRFQLGWSVVMGRQLSLWYATTVIYTLCVTSCSYLFRPTDGYMYICIYIHKCHAHFIQIVWYCSIIDVCISMFKCHVVILYCNILSLRFSTSLGKTKPSRLIRWHLCYRCTDSHPFDICDHKTCLNQRRKTVILK